MKNTFNNQIELPLKTSKIPLHGYAALPQKEWIAFLEMIFNGARKEKFIIQLK